MAKPHFFNILAGIFQGDTLAPFLFIVVLDYALKEALKISDEDCGIVIEPKQGSRFPEIRLRDLAYVDDIALINKSLKLAENLLHCVESSARMVGLHLNAGKTEINTSCIANSLEAKSLSCPQACGSFQILGGLYTRQLPRFQYTKRFSMGCSK